MRPIETAEILSVGSELTVGETRDTNAGELAGSLTDAGVTVLRLSALPDDLASVREAFLAGLARADLVVSTGGLGPTPDDLTREAIAAAVGEVPVVDPELDAWLRGLFARRNAAFAASNVKQAWRIPSARPVPNANGTAPGWWVDRPDGRVIVALPGPPREMRPMWQDWVRPRLAARGLGVAMAVVTLRTTGIGESLLADRLGDLLSRDANPTVATYARADGVDIRISARPDPRADATPEALVAAAESQVLDLVGANVWGRGDASWGSAIADALARRRWRMSLREIGTRGSVVSLLGEALGDRLVRAETIVAATSSGSGARVDLSAVAEAARVTDGCEVGLAVRARSRGGDTAVSIGLADPGGRRVVRRLAFLGGSMGRTRAATTAAAVLVEHLRG